MAGNLSVKLAAAAAEKMLWRVILLLVMFLPHTVSVAVDVALNKPITAQITCGAQGPEEYLDHDQVFVKPADRESKLKQCFNASAHPADSMVDGNSSTWWQSMSRTKLISAGYGKSTTSPESVIQLDLEQNFEAQRITIGMADSKRPGTIILFKSPDGISFLPWVYRVTDETDCNLVWKVPVQYTPRNLNSVVCQAYANTADRSNEQIIFDFSGITGNVAPWRNVRYLRIQFYQMALTLGPNGIRFQHYTVKKLEILAECTCNGLQTDCVQSNITRQFECVCGGNAEGKYCEKCKPFYNQQAFTYGQKCESCYCFQHSDRCYFNQTVNNYNLSINTNGERDGGGVCIDCKDNTTGVNCERCLPYHYRPITVSQTRPDPCILCNCHGPGVRVNLETGLVGDCVMNNDTLLPPGMQPGDCFCKSNVTGSRCDTCKPGFFDLTADKVTGCQDCLCETAGTVGGTTVCMSNATGQCPCKANVINRRCNECKDEFYGLNSTKPNGCTSCECDVGGSLNNLCNKESGMCPCRSNVVDRQCTRPKTSFFYPKLHFIHQEFEDLQARWSRTKAGFEGWGYAIVTSNTAVMTTLSPTGTNTLNGLYQILIRFRTPNVSPVEGTVSIVGNTGSFSEAVVFPSSATQWSFLTVGQALQKTYTLNQGYKYSISVSAKSELYVDRVIALPRQFTNTTALFGAAENLAFNSRCKVYENDMRLGTADESYCLGKVFSLTSYYLGGALPCGCSSIGAYNNSCEPYGGQCLCKPGVGRRTCDECQLENWNLQSTGCTYCNCSTVNKVCDRFTGQCLCPPNIEGRQCDRCKPNHWNFNDTLGCEPCNCNTTGSLNLQCNQTTGICQCKTGINGAKCDTCLDTYRAFSSQGCVLCNCDQYGSLNDVCQKDTGQCQCKQNTMGLTCVMCKPGTFYNYRTHRDGCLDCVCMGVTSSCDSTPWRNKDIQLPLQNATSPYLLITTPTQTQLLDITMVNQYGLTLARVSLGAQADVYWLHPFELRGNMLGLYGNNVSWTTIYDSTDLSGKPTQPKIILFGRNNTRFDLSVPIVQLNVSTQLQVPIQVESVTDRNVSRGEFLYALSDVKMLLIPASYYDRAHVSYIANWKYDIASPIGLGQRAMAVEKCNCGPGYEGLSCENCVRGYKRFNVSGQGYLGTCIPCQCYGHASYCNPDTGVCDSCLHNTAGENCEVCNVGFHGNPKLGNSYDCQPCPCYAPRVVNGTCNSTSGRPICTYCNPGYAGDLCDRCDTFYYGNPVILGGTCTRCECNNNAVTCNSANGQCLNCANNSTGSSCERCIDGFYGNATIQGCTDCVCNMTGSNSSVCDHSTGQCPCKFGVGDRDCDQCLPNYYGYDNTSILGCATCDCNPSGSGNLQCDSSGVCTCQTNVVGEKCDSCVDGFFGLPSQACQACNCNTTGTANLTMPCDRVTGQCLCKNGVTGRQCDKCERMYTNFGVNGCARCDDCQFSLGNDTRRMKEEWEGYWNQSQVVSSLQEQDVVLQGVSSKINSTSETLGVSSGTLVTLTKSLANLTSREPVLNDTVANLIARVTTITNLAGSLENNSAADLTRQIDMQESAKNALANAENLNKTCPLVIDRMRFYNTSSYTLLKLGDTAYTGLNYTFTNEKLQVLEELQQITDIRVRVDQMKDMVGTQANKTTELDSTSRQQNAQFTNITGDAAQVNSLLQTVMTLANGVLNQINGTLYNKQYAESLFAEATQILAMTEGILTGETQGNYDSAAQNFRDIVSVINGVNTGNLATIANTTVDLTDFDTGEIDPWDLVDISDVVSFGLPPPPRLPAPPPRPLGVSRAPPELSIAHQDLFKTVYFSSGGITGWRQGSSLEEAMINTTRTLLQLTTTNVLSAEQKANNLTTLAQALLTEFKRVEQRGKDAVDSITHYEDVIKTLAASLMASMEANATMAEATSALQQISIVQLETDANQTRARSEALAVLAGAWNSTPSVWNPLIDAANTSLVNAVSTWDIISQRIISYNIDVANVSSISTGAQIGTELSLGNAAADNAIRVADVNLNADNLLRGSVEREAVTITTVKNTARNATLLQTSINTRMDAFQKKLNNEVQSYIDLSERDYNQTQGTRKSIDAKIIELEAKVKRARDMLALLEQPVAFRQNSHEQVVNPDMNKPQQYSSIQLDFSYEIVGQGILFFTQNNLTLEKLLIQIVDNKVVYEYSNVDLVMKSESKAVLSAGTWFRVVATRYDIDGQLTVTKLSTGGVAVEHMRGMSTTHGRLTLNSPIYVGGLPLGFQTSKVYNTSRDFVGCVYQLQFNGITLPLWQTVLQHTSTASCCKKPPVIPPPPSITALTFKGLGSFLELNAGSLSVVDQVQVSLQFRTFGHEGVILLADKADTSAYVGLFIQNGQLTFHVFSPSGNVQLVPTTDSARKRRAPVTVMDGEWRQLTAMFNRTYAIVTLSYVNQSISAQNFVNSASNLNLNTSSLAGATVTVGAQNSLDGLVNRGPTTRSFAGAIKEFQRSVAPSLTLETFYLNAAVNKSKRTDLNKAYETVLNGLGIDDPTGYATLRDVPATVDTIEFEFMSYAPSGIMIYALITANPVQTFLYIALYHGDVFLIFNQGLGVQTPLRTRGLYLSTGKKNTVRLDFSFQNSPRLAVNGVTHYGAVTMNPHMYIKDNTLYAGGVPPLIPLDTQDLPVKGAMLGCISNLQVNSQAMNFFSLGTLTPGSQKGVYLSGCSAPPTELPPLPYSTTPAPPSTPAPTCATPQELNATGSGMRFGDEAVSYVAYNITNERNVFTEAFSISFAFRALQSNGILAYFASTTASNPPYYFVIYMHQGFIKANMVSNTRDPRTKGIKSKFTYDDGQWHEVEILRINDFMAVIVQARRDYYNNQVQAAAVSTLVVGTDFYVGGVPAQFVGLPFTSATDLPIGKTSFHGCIKNLKAVTHKYEEAKFNPNNIKASVGVNQCFNNVIPGVFLNATNSYVKVMNTTKRDFTINRDLGFTVRMTFRTFGRNGTLLAAYKDSRNFVLLGLYKGELRAVMSNSGSPNAPFMAISEYLKNSYDICNNQQRKVYMNIATTGLTLQVDSFPAERFSYPTGYTFSTMYFTPIFVGGFKDQSVSIPLKVLSTSSFQGCLESVAVQQWTYMLTQSEDKQAIMAGCPSP